MNERTGEMVWVGAFRYYCGRRTYAVESFCDALIAAWDGLPERAKIVIARDLKSEFERDDAARAAGESIGLWKSLGDDCDRASWERVLDHIQGHNAGVTGAEPQAKRSRLNDGLGGKQARNHESPDCM